MKLLSEFSQLIPRYRAVFFDAYGVLRDGSGVFPGVLDVVRDLGRPAWVITNDASRTSEAQAAPLKGALEPDRIVSAGLLAADYLARSLTGQCVAWLGPPGCAGWFERSGNPATPLLDVQDDATVDVLVLMDEGGFDWERGLNRVVNLLRRRPDLPFLAPNPDRLFPVRGEEVGLGVGSLVVMLQAVLGIQPLTFGKPDRAIFEHALNLARRELPDLRPTEVLMVGDTLETDVAGGRAAGLATALTLSGNVPADDWQAAVARTGIEPDHVVASIAS